MQHGREDYIRIFQSPWRFSTLELVISQVDRNGSDGRVWGLVPESNTESPSPMKWVEVGPFTTDMVGYQFDKRCGQQLMDDLWAAGVRPADMPAEGGVSSASQQHIADLRALLFHKEGLPLA